MAGAPADPRARRRRRSASASRSTTNGAIHRIGSSAKVRLKPSRADRRIARDGRAAARHVRRDTRWLSVANRAMLMIDGRWGRMAPCSRQQSAADRRAEAEPSISGPIRTANPDETLGTNTAREYFLFGRDRAFLDVIGHQGNDFQITGEFWRELNALTPNSTSPAGSCASQAMSGAPTLPSAATATSVSPRRRNHPPLKPRADHRRRRHGRRGRRRPRRGSLFQKLAGKDCVVMAHVGGRYADIKYAHDGRLETAVEVHPRGARSSGSCAMPSKELSRRRRVQFGRPQGTAGRVLSRSIILRRRAG